MLNTIDAYHEAGVRCARARNEGDEARARSWSDWVRQAWSMETTEDRRSAKDAYYKGYEAARTAPKGLYF